VNVLIVLFDVGGVGVKETVYFEAIVVLGFFYGFECFVRCWESP